MTSRPFNSTVPAIQSVVTPSDSTVLEGVRSIYCLTAGNLILRGQEGVSVTYPMTAGQSVFFSPTRVMAATTGTYVAHK
jgi:hypothetical protein